MDVSVDKSVIRTLLDEVGGEAFERLVGIFIEECDRNYSEIALFLSRDNLSGAEIVAHRFKSTARQFGVSGLAEVCEELERACVEGHKERTSELLSAMAVDLPQVLENLTTATASASASIPKGSLA